jgi:subtilisin family serine protease
LFVLVASHPEIGATFCKWDETARGSEAKNEELRKWLGRSKAAAEKSKAKEVARAAVQELQRKLPDSVLRPQGLLGEASKRAAEAADPDSANPPALIRRVFLDRKATLAAEEGVCTIKADAASRLFNVSCRDITWAIIDSGIATKHPAFVDHQTAAEGGVASNGTSRVRAILDFTLIEKIRSFDLIADGYKGKERDKAIAEVIEQLHGLPDEPELENFDEVAKEKLQLIAAQLEAHLQPDWNLIEPLIRRKPGKGDPKLVSGHGTHVAGILGADWREQDNGTEKKILEGVCPDINFHDLRVINHRSRESTEFAILAALEYVQFANRRTSGMQQVIQGVNISLSIPHEVRNYACGATPVCVACDSLVGSGVVVVAAAGNRGWNEQELGFGSFVFCSITDPGNAQDVITVGATHRLKPHTYGVSFFSSRGPTGDGRNKPDLVAPGENIKGPVLGDTDDELDGTSMAAPFVSGAAAMLIARHGELYGRPQRIKEILCRSATDLGREKYFQGHGLVDVLRAIQSV